MRSAGPNGSVVAFGHGLFQQCLIVPVLYQLGTVYYNAPASLVSDESLIVGVELSKPVGFNGSNEEFAVHVESNIDAVELTVSIFHESSDVLRETLYKETLGVRPGSRPDDPLCFYEVTSRGVLIMLHSILSLAAQFRNTPLTMVATVGLAVAQEKLPRNRAQKNESEVDIRLLVDVGRHRPPTIPSRVAQMQVQVALPLRVESYVREISSERSVLSLAVRNVLPSCTLGLHDLVFTLDRTTPGLPDSKPGEQVFSSLFRIALISSIPTTLTTGAASIPFSDGSAVGHGAMGAPVISILPLGEYTLLYSITPTSPISVDALRWGLAMQEYSLFTTPCTAFWSVRSVKPGASDVPAAEYTAEIAKVMECVMSRSVGNSAVCNETGFSVAWSLGSGARLSRGTDVALHDARWLGINVEGRQQVFLGETVELRACVTNMTARPLRRLSLCCENGEAARYICAETVTPLG
ncbi:hypothetical protein B484DRAFT_451201 [Ochromonadaceae sp. CCMP2298]|nr:hypothetical protein B484DRAFT_451201 [Ochromonadaceae sp. CCMP2298]|mmetsp:Transcript_25721/g.56895  ORF Transcript_25721/g.56895 Transcript_25721/m.56895 type:complete len:466 (-) Transcript_25721:317-1714(-)